MGSPDDVVPVSSRERRLAEAVAEIAECPSVTCYAQILPVIAEARAVLASPEADPKAHLEVYPANGLWHWYLKVEVEGPIRHNLVSHWHSENKDAALASARQVAHVLGGLPVREPKP